MELNKSSAIVLDSRKLRVEVAMRGWTFSELASRAGISRPTVTAALQERPVAALNSLCTVIGTV